MKLIWKIEPSLHGDNGGVLSSGARTRSQGFAEAASYFPCASDYIIIAREPGIFDVVGNKLSAAILDVTTTLVTDFDKLTLRMM